MGDIGANGAMGAMSVKHVSIDSTHAIFLLPGVRESNIPARGITDIPVKWSALDRRRRVLYSAI